MINASIRPALSVLITCYNRENYIETAVRSIQAQTIESAMEIVVSDDCSSDRTPAIVANMQATDPRIVLLRSDRRLGVSRNFARAIAHARGKYIATLDDDDYWIDPHKCQRQYDYLEAHPTISGVFESVLVVDESGSTLREHVVAGLHQRVTHADFVSRYPLTTQTVMVRRSACPVFPDWGFNTAMQDWVFAWEVSKRGDFVCSGHISAAYRQSGTSLWAAQSPRMKLAAYFNMVGLLNQHGALDIDRRARERQYAHAYAAFRHYVDGDFSLREAIAIGWLLSRWYAGNRLASFVGNLAWVLRTFVSRYRRRAW